MSKIIDITNKLNFEERPKFKVKNIEFETSGALAMLRAIPKQIWMMFSSNSKKLSPRCSYD